MKEIYKTFNDVELDEKEFIELDVNDIEKAQVKKYLHQKITKKKTRRKWLPRIAVASLLFIICGIGIGLAFPAYAGSIPIVRDIFKFIDGDRSALYENYKEFSTEVGITEKSKGIDITMNDVIFDGETILATYSISSDLPLGENPRFQEFISLKNADGYGAGSEIVKVDDQHYVGMLTVGNFGENVEDRAHIVWKIDKILNSETDKVINGNWRFAFTVEATERYTEQVNEFVEQDGIKVTIEKITHTPMSTIVYARQQLSENVLQQWNDISLEYTMTDDLGNFYEGRGNGSRGFPDNMTIPKTFEKLDEDSSTLTIVPQLRLLGFPQDGEESEQTEGVNEFGETFVSNSAVSVESKEFTMKPIVIELKKKD